MSTAERSADLQPGGDQVGTKTADSRSLLDSERLWNALMALTPAMVFVAGRLANLWTVQWLARERGEKFLESLSSWDGEHFIAIAEHGYTWSTADGVVASPAFFPGLPKLMALVSAVLGCSASTAGLLISAAAGVVTAYGLVRLAERVPGLTRTGGLFLVAVYSLAPMSIVLSMTYSESLFVACAVWSLAFLMDGNWLVSGLLSLLAGLVRPSGFALAAAIVVAAALAFVQGTTTWRTWVGTALAPLGFLGYIAYADYRLGAVGAWFELQRVRWRSGFDWGAATWRFVVRTLREAPALLDVATVGLMLAALVLLGVCVVSAVSGLNRVPWPLVLYAGFVLLQVLGSDGVMNSKGRLLIPAFTLLIPLAAFLQRERRSVGVGLIIGIGLAGCWYSAYALLIYGYAI